MFCTVSGGGRRSATGPGPSYPLPTAWSVSFGASAGSIFSTYRWTEYLQSLSQRLAEEPALQSTPRLRRPARTRDSRRSTTRSSTSSLLRARPRVRGDCGNLMAARLTVLYGESGVGKTPSCGGRVHHLRNLPEPHGVVLFDSWQDDPAPLLRAAIGDACGFEPVGTLTDTLALVAAPALAARCSSSSTRSRSTSFTTRRNRESGRSSRSSPRRCRGRRSGRASSFRYERTRLPSSTGSRLASRTSSGTSCGSSTSIVHRRARRSSALWSATTNCPPTARSASSRNSSNSP